MFCTVARNMAVQQYICISWAMRGSLKEVSHLKWLQSWKIHQMHQEDDTPAYYFGANRMEESRDAFNSHAHTKM